MIDKMCQAAGVLVIAMVIAMVVLGVGVLTGLGLI